MAIECACYTDDVAIAISGHFLSTLGDITLTALNKLCRLVISSLPYYSILYSTFSAFYSISVSTTMFQIITKVITVISDGTKSPLVFSDN